MQNPFPSQKTGSEPMSVLHDKGYVMKKQAEENTCIALVELKDILLCWKQSWAARCSNNQLLTLYEEACAQLEMASGNIPRYRKQWHKALLKFLEVALEINELFGADEDELGESWDMQHLGGESFELSWTAIDESFIDFASWQVRVQDDKIECSVEWQCEDALYFLPSPSECIEQEHNH